MPIKNFINLAAFFTLFVANSSLAQIWQSVQDVPGNCSSIGINPKNKRTVWFGARSRRLFVSLGRVYVGMLASGAAGAFMSANGGATWTLLNAGLPTTNETGHAFMLKSDGGLSGLYLADFFLGAHKLETLTTPISSTANVLPHSFALLQNYPNPFNPATTIRYSLPSAQHVVLKVFDILGGEVATLIDERQAAGDYAIDFDASRLVNSGIYLYQINAGPFQQARKMIFAQ